MSIVERKQELFENVARLRRLSRRLPGNEDLATVRAALEKELGPTVSQRMAARILGVSHVALRRWIDSGDLPLVYTTEGRREVPVPALLRLRDGMEAGQSRAGRYVMAPTLKGQRKAAEALRIGQTPGRSQDPHDRARARSLAYHRALARKLRRPMVEEAKHVLFTWRQAGKISSGYADRWQELLDQPVATIRRAIVEKSPDADDLRQNSPFAGQLSEAERRRIVREVG
jgi:hypothetical protein